MTIYLTIITTVLVLTQIIRVAQNHIQLKRQKDEIFRRVEDLELMNPTVTDFENQREAMRLLRAELENRRMSAQKLDSNNRDVIEEIL